MTFKRTLVTCALPYANGPVHIGHLAGVYVPADIYVRYLRLRGEDVRRRSTTSLLPSTLGPQATITSAAAATVKNFESFITVYVLKFYVLFALDAQAGALKSHKYR